jgi:hypothetical protein
MKIIFGQNQVLYKNGLFLLAAILPKMKLLPELK